MGDSTIHADGIVAAGGMGYGESGFREVAEDAALAIVDTDRCVSLLSSTTGAKAATFTSQRAGQMLRLVLQARSGGSYTFACDFAGTTGTLTLDAADEAPELIYDGSAWQVIALNGATHA